MDGMLTALLPFPAPVQLERRVATVETVVAELARKSGQDLRIKREMKDEILYVSLKPHEPTELKDLVAKAASAEWMEDAGHVYLGRSSDLIRKQEREDRAALAKEIAGAIKPYVYPNDRIPWPAGVNQSNRQGTEWERLMEIEALGSNAREAAFNAFTPGGRFLSRILRSLPPEDIASVARGTVSRFVVRPNRRQRVLPAGANVRQYETERRKMMDDLIDAGAGLDGEEAASAYGIFNGQIDPTFSVSRDAEGHYHLDNQSIEIDPGVSWNARRLPGYGRWSGRSLKLGRSTASFVAGMKGEAVSPSEAIRLRDPVANEPLAALMTDPMEDLRNAMGAEEAIVALPDETARDAGRRLMAKPQLGNFADGLSREVASEVENGRWLGRARLPTEVFRTKTDRTVLRNFARQLAQGFPRLAMIARYALTQNSEASLSGFEGIAMEGAGFWEMGWQPDAPRGWEYPRPRLYEMLNVRLKTDGETMPPVFSAGDSRDLLRIYASLSPSQSVALEQGRSVTVAELSPAARISLETLLFLREGKFGFYDDKTKRWQFLDPTSVSDSLPPGMTISTIRETSELGPPRGPYVESLRADPMNAPSASDLGFPAYELGYQLLSQERGEKPPRGYPVAKTARFVPGWRENFSIVVRLDGRYQLVGNLQDLVFDAPGRAVPYEKLPPEHLKEIQRGYGASKRRETEGG